jgi:ribonucleoside-triphosphate reductase
MSHPQRIHGAKVLKAVSATIRINLLNMLFDKGPMSYTELMNSLKMNPSRDAGRFAYHLKFLLKADLIEADVEAKKYRLSDLGKMVVGVADEIEKKALRPKRVLVRTSRFTLEEFDANRIADSLIKEANVPADLAQRIAKETEKQLLKSKTKYLTAPLVREVVNAILIEKGLEEHRHKLTRLGLPVHEVATLIARSKTSKTPSFICETAGKAVVEEYTLLNVLPRDVSDAYLSGALHINELSDWILKPSEVMHDMRLFFQKGLSMEAIDVYQPTLSPPKSLESALALVNSVLLYSSKEVGETQTFDYFNIFLAPFIKGKDVVEVKETLRLFLLNLSHHVNVTLGLELALPDFIVGKPAYGSSGIPEDKYGDFKEESQQLASVLLEIFVEESVNKPLLNPKLAIKLRPETFTDEKAKATLLKAHQLASEKGIIYFANLSEENQKHSTFSSSGIRLNADPKGDWEIDTLRAGNLGIVTINLPRIAYECEMDEAKFFDLLRERLEMASRALEIKSRSLRQYAEGLLPFLMQKVNGDHYFRLENSVRTINLVGLREAAGVFSGKNTFEEEKTLKFAEKIVQQALEFTGRTGRRREKRLFPAILPSSEASERLARLDIEKFGVAKTRFMGTREKPCYSSVSRFVLKDGRNPELLKTEGRLHKLCANGNLTVMELEEAKHEPEELVALTKELVENYEIGFFTYNRNLIYCVNCKKSRPGLMPKCPDCGSVSTLTTFNRFKA